jgi:hypothetical protein
MKSALIIVTIFLATVAFGAQPHTNSVVLPLTAVSQLLIPAAGNTPGANGTFFHSDISIVNFSSHDQLVKLDWIPQSGGTGSATTLTIPAQSGIRSADFVATYMNQTGLGSIMVSGVTAAGVPDTSALLFASTRIWTMQPGSSGTTSQSLPAVPVSTVNTQIAALFASGGADNPAGYRTNVGIVNLDPINPQTYLILLPSQTGGATVGGQITLQPMSMQQVSVGSGIAPTQEILIQNITTVGRTNSWLAYGSSVDNVTGDAWSELAVAGTSQ